MKNDKTIIDDGFRPELVEGAAFDGIFEIPHVPGPSKIILPEGMIPFSKIKYSNANKEFVHFYEHDIRFRGILTSTDEYLNALKKFPGVINPDCSLYRDMPLTLQITNTYMSRAVGFFFWKNGIYSIPNIRWGDERSYTMEFFSKPFAFAGVDKHSIVSIGTYGCIRGQENRKHFKAGLKAMLGYLEPQVVLVYGPMSKEIFNEFIGMTKFVRFDDWIKVKKQEASFARSFKGAPFIDDVLHANSSDALHIPGSRHI